MAPPVAFGFTKKTADGPSKPLARPTLAAFCGPEEDEKDRADRDGGVLTGSGVESAKTAALLVENPNLFSYDDDKEEGGGGDNLFEEEEERKTRCGPPRPIEEGIEGGLILRGRRAPRAKSSFEDQTISSRYIAGLITTSKRREIEDEIIETRRLKKEHDADVAKHGEKEVFVTRAYQRRLEERKKIEEELAREEMANAAQKSKEGGLATFHRAMLSQGLMTRSRGGEQQIAAKKGEKIEEDSSREGVEDKREADSSVEGRTIKELPLFPSAGCKQSEDMLASSSCLLQDETKSLMNTEKEKVKNKIEEESKKREALNRYLERRKRTKVQSNP